MSYMELQRATGFMTSGSRMSKPMGGAPFGTTLCLIPTWPRGYEAAFQEAAVARRQDSVPVLLRLASQDFPDMEQVTRMRDEHLVLLSVPARLSKEGCTKEELLAAVNEALWRYKEDLGAWMSPSGELPDAAAQTITSKNELSDDERREFLREVYRRDR